MSSQPTPDPDRTICFCHAVSWKELVEAIHQGACTIEKLQAETCCSTGCGGCESEVREILETQMDQKDG